MRVVQGVGAFLCVLAMASIANAEQVTERHTDATFDVERTIGGQNYILVGTGARRAAGMINVYGAGMYVGANAGSKAWNAYLTGRFAKAGLVEGGTPNFEKIGHHATGRHYIVYGRFPRAIDMAFTRDVSAEQIQGAYEESWDRVQLDRAAAGEALGQFMAAVNRPVSSGQRMMLRTQGNTISVNVAGNNTNIQGNRALVIAIWKIWFGNPPLQRPLRDGMLYLLQNIHRRATGG